MTTNTSTFPIPHNADGDHTLVHGQTYWLGATSGVYNADTGNFDLGNCFVYRSETPFKDWKTPTCEHCDTPMDAPNFAYHFCTGRKTTEQPTQELTDEQEAEITRMMAHTYWFKLRENDAKCLLCGRRLQKNYIGLPMNERMIKHFARHQRTHKPRTDWKKEQPVVLTLTNLSNGDRFDLTAEDLMERDDRGPEYWRTNQTDLTVEMAEHDRNCRCPSCEGQPWEEVEDHARRVNQALGLGFTVEGKWETITIQIDDINTDPERDVNDESDRFVKELADLIRKYNKHKVLKIEAMDSSNTKIGS